MYEQQDIKPRRTLIQWIGQRILGLTVAALVIVVATTLAGFFARHHWAADIFTNLRVQQVIGLLGASVVLAIGRQWKWLFVAFILLGVHAPWFTSAFLGTFSTDGQQTSGQSELVVMTANVLTSNRQHDAVLKQIESANADVFAILELGTPLYQRLEKELSGTYPHRITIPQDAGNFGIGLYSRHSLTDVERFSINADDIESIAATVTTDSASYRIIATHPLPPVGSGGFQSRNEHLQVLADRVSAFRNVNSAIPVVVMGDLNLTPWSPLFAEFESRSGLAQATGGSMLVPTWYAYRKRMALFPFGLVLDHVLISEDLRCVRREIGADVGSDHRAVIVAVTNVETAESK